MREWEKFLAPCKEGSEGCEDCTDGVQNKHLMKFFSARETFRQHEYVSEKSKVCDCFVVYEGSPVLYAVEILAGKLTESELKDKAEQLEACRSFVRQWVCYKNIRCVLIYGSIDRRLKMRQRGKTKAELLAQKKEIILMEHRRYREGGLQPFVR
ncbi:MAG: hypothetical protein NZ933_02745 [Bacteroidia bacterium]|nr:hypothetical protein [Bacteroidia bacterium]MDW8088124.1 hypothetical protein [Bacteroidia bacterium]